MSPLSARTLWNASSGTCPTGSVAAAISVGAARAEICCPMPSRSSNKALMFRVEIEADDSRYGTSKIFDGVSAIRRCRLASPLAPHPSVYEPNAADSAVSLCRRGTLFEIEDPTAHLFGKLAGLGPEVLIGIACHSFHFCAVSPAARVLSKVPQVAMRSGVSWLELTSAISFVA